MTWRPPYHRIRPVARVKAKVIRALLAPSSRSDLYASAASSRVLLANLSFSYSSAAKAFTTLMPVRFSWRTVTISPISS